MVEAFGGLPDALGTDVLLALAAGVRIGCVGEAAADAAVEVDGVVVRLFCHGRLQEGFAVLV